uniref:EGF-like domain-containing protein n=1 Tax=Parascaris univalens TaxID=6257 RepID=A0A915BW90_PARUN
MPTTSIWILFLLDIFVALFGSVSAANVDIFNTSAIQSPPIYFGPDISINITCLNGGSIIDGKCHCQPRFEGIRCESEPCLNGGMKSSSSSNGKCHCPYGLTGEKCETITHCVEGKGKLVDGKCKCTDRWTGLFCQLRTCYNGVSIGTGAETFCLCDIGYKGPFCDLPIICIHGAISSENICVCEPHWAGENCDRCAIDHRLVDNECTMVISEESLISLKNEEAAELWPLLAVGCAALVVVVFVAASSAILLRRCQSKPSRVSRTTGTHV